VAELKAKQNQSDVGHKISLREAFPTWLRVGGLSFGGPAGEIAIIGLPRETML